MWNISVRRHGETLWEPIWAAVGRGAESAALARFARIRSKFTGEWDDEDNDFAEQWEAALLTRNGAMVGLVDRTSAAYERKAPSSG